MDTEDIFVLFIFIIIAALLFCMMCACATHGYKLDGILVGVMFVYSVDCILHIVTD